MVSAVIGMEVWLRLLVVVFVAIKIVAASPSPEEHMGQPEIEQKPQFIGRCLRMKFQIKCFYVDSLMRLSTMYCHLAILNSFRRQKDKRKASKAKILLKSQNGKLLAMYNSTSQKSIQDPPRPPPSTLIYLSGTRAVCSMHWKGR